MKKIITAVAAVAMAASMFAVDMSAALKMNGSLFDMTFADGAKPSILTLKTPEGRKPWGQTGIDLNVSADKAGATMNIQSDGKIVGYKLYVQPVDAVKINFGDLDYCLNKESIDYAGCLNGTGSNGFGIDIKPVDGLTFNVVINPGFGNAWIANDVIGSTAVMAKYGADFGTIGFAWLATSDAPVAAGTKVKDGYYKLDDDHYIELSSNSFVGKATATEATAAKAGKIFANNTLSVGYSNTFGSVNMFADVAMVLTDKLTNVKADAFVKTSIDALGIAAYADMNLDTVTNKVAVGAKAKLTYALDGLTPYLYVKCANFTKEGKFTNVKDAKDNNPIVVKPGVTWNIGAASCEVAAEFNICSVEGQSTVSVPFGVSVNF